MTIETMVASDSPLLVQRALHVQRVTRETQRLLDSMIETMEANCGIGIAAPQIGHMLRLCVVRVVPGKPPVFMVNPEVTFLSLAMFDVDEGCLSFPGEVVRVNRHAGIGVRFLDYHGHRRRCTAEGLSAVCIQHEIDHLDGVTMHMRAVRP